MKITVAILGSTGSIGETLLKIIKKNKKKFNVVLLSANTSDKKLLQQANDFNVRNLIVTNKNSFNKIKKKNIKKLKI